MAGGEGVGWPGLGATRERGRARDGVYAGGAAVEEQSDSELMLAGVRAGGGGVLEVWGGELPRERGDWDAGVPLMLKRTRGREPGLFPEIATATAMWRPRSMTGATWRGEEGSSAGGSGAGGCEGAACSGGAAGGGLPAFLSSGGTALRRRQRKQRERRETTAGPVCKFIKV
ncbi:translation initiation factor IF-2-like [Panicum virgatum]|uniref:translation initiation factor IF-2-like n=1 Tax=Panicum virgatum TaxID=38727 RepID=UPI0019D64F5D|nr:translation initiation factor IF-2-like [Panicum virgatum]